MCAALYGRVSTIDKGQDPGLQLRDLRTYAAARGRIRTPKSLLFLLFGISSLTLSHQQFADCTLNPWSID
jgi:hypothetical protein